MNNAIKTKIIQLMTQENLPQLCIDVFLSHYATMVANEDSAIREEHIKPISDLVELDALPDFSTQGKIVLNQAIMIKLNGGLGTGMGLKKAKSLLIAKKGLSFLEIIVKQVLSQRNRFNSSLPLVFMNSFNTETDTKNLLDRFPELIQGQKDIPFTFIQNKVPKLFSDSKEPATWPSDPSKVWCPPGHGDIYTALQTSGLLDQLLTAEIYYAFISNADNLGANLDLSVLGYFSEQDTSFMMEVADRTAADKKGGHLAQCVTGDGLILRESAQCHPDDSKSFQDFHKYKYFNTNNLWLRLDRLKDHLDANNGMLSLSLIQNSKTMDPEDASSPKVIQMETAMGAAISNFNDSTALRIPKTRFIPIKTTNELLGLWSNAFILDKNYLVVTNPKRKANAIVIHLDPHYYSKIDDLQAHFPSGAPDLIDCQQFTISGDVRFSANVKIIGSVTINNTSDRQLVIEPNTVFENDLVYHEIFN